MREVRLMREGQEVEAGEFASDEVIADHFGTTTPRERGAIKQICEWADEQGCDQGFATDDVSSLVVSPAWE